MGEPLVLGSAFLWAFATVLAKPMTGRVRPGTIVAAHAWVAVLIGLVLLVSLGRLDELGSIGFRQMALLGLSASFILVGDVFLVRSFVHLDAGKAFTVASGLFVLFTLFAGWLFIGDPVSRATFAGALAILIGVYMTRDGGAHADASPVAPGATMAAMPTVLLAGLMWAVGLIGMDRAIDQVDPVAGSTIGYLIPAVAYLAWVSRSLRADTIMPSLDSSARRMFIASASFGGLALVGYALGIKYANAGIVAMLESTAPIFAILLAVALFKERLSVRAGAGVGFCAAGIAAIVI